MLLRHTLDEGGVVAHRLDLLRIAHDALVGRQIVPEIVGLEQQPLRLEVEESFLEAWPFLFDDAPDETGGKDALGHNRQNAIVSDVSHGGIVGRRPQKRRKLRLAALAFGGSGADFRQVWHFAFISVPRF